jgi:hypothetical protein
MYLPIVAVVAALVAVPAIAQKKVITSADQMPRREYQIPKLPSELLAGPKTDLDGVVNAVDRDLAEDLATLDIQDRATRTSLMQARAAFAVHRGDYKAAQVFLRDIRSQQEKAADQLLSGVTMENILDARIAGGPEAAQREKVKASMASRWSAMPWDVVGTNLKSAKSQLELMSREVVIGAIQTNMDPAAKNLNLKVPGSMVVSVVAVRNNFEHVLPFRDDLVATLQGLVDRNQVARADVWTQRLVTLPAGAPAKPVVVGIWDSGTDVSLFKAASIPGIAFDRDMKETQPLVRPMGAAEARLPVLKQYVKGSMDMQAAIDSPEARALKARVSTLKQDEVKQFMEDLAAVGMWVHGTHVAGIAVDGNPFAQVTAVAMHWSHESRPEIPTEERSHRAAAAYRKAVDHFRKTGTRVVNMSWRYGPQFHEGALAYHNVGKTPEERKQMALKLFAIEKAGLESAIAGAPEILFVAGSGNEDNSADFSQYIPAGFQLPNLITAGAVDQSGTETAFSTFGKTVVVHANGFEVPSYMPGGEKTKLSGTSMASPQVANLAAKLFALKPGLTPVQVKELILKGAEKTGRVNLINPKKTLEMI